MEDNVEVMIAPERIVKLSAEPRDLFVIISALKDRGFNPHVRVVDKEIGGWTCWQPTSKEAA